MLLDLFYVNLHFSPNEKNCKILRQETAAVVLVELFFAHFENLSIILRRIENSYRTFKLTLIC